MAIAIIIIIMIDNDEIEKHRKFPILNFAYLFAYLWYEILNQ